MASAGTDGQVIVWDAATGQKQDSLTRPRSRDRTWAVAFHPLDGRHLAAGYSEKRVMIWDCGDVEKEPVITHRTYQRCLQRGLQCRRPLAGLCELA